MNGTEFIEIFKEIIQTNMDIDLDAYLTDIEEWDSMAMMALIAHFDAKYSIPLEFPQLEKLRTVREVAMLAPDFWE